MLNLIGCHKEVYQVMMALEVNCREVMGNQMVMFWDAAYRMVV
jgi:hypothetical protein